MARCTAGAAHAGAGTDRRRAGPDGAHHRARQGEPGPRSARTRRDSRRRPVRTGAGWSTSPTCRPGRGSAAPPSSRGLFSRRIVGRGRRQPHGAPTTRPAPPGRRSGRRKHRDGGDLEGLVHHSDHGSKSPVHRLHRATRRRGHRSPRPKAVGSSLRRRRRPGPGQAPCKRGARSGATAPGRTATTSKPQPPAG